MILIRLGYAYLNSLYSNFDRFHYNCKSISIRFQLISSLKVVLFPRYLIRFFAMTTPLVINTPGGVLIKGDFLIRGSG